MKPIPIMLIFNLIMLLATGQTPGYQSFPDNARWRVDHYYINPYQFPCYIKHYFDYSMQGDTTINQLIYKRIYRSWVASDTLSCDDPNAGNEAPVPGYAGALRDDPSANGAFFRFPESSADSLLFDYNLQTGDTLRGFISRYLSHYTMVVNSIDSVLTDDGLYHKRWNFEGIHNHPSYIIQGVGSSFGLIEPAYTYALDFTERFLVCLTLDNGTNSQTLFTSEYTSEMGCSPVVQKVQSRETAAAFSIYPNPMTTTATLFSHKYMDRARVVIANLQGQVVAMIPEVSGYQCILTRDGLNNGVYFVTMIQDQTVFSKKLVVR